MDASSKDRSPHPPTQDGFERLVLCSGKVYYELLEERSKRGMEDKVRSGPGALSGVARWPCGAERPLTTQVALVRIEQLNPFPFDLVMREIRRFPNAELVWTQVGSPLGSLQVTRPPLGGTASFYVCWCFGRCRRSP